MAKTTTKVGEEEIKLVMDDNKYSKQKILKSKKYSDKQDLINALLKDDTQYSITEVDELINNFMKGVVK
ncbi:hypothetical protein [Clostridium neonatale]|uniref:hypothetical protein n=1 Tax=Clostridium neonatale TaxID=137838 RepID=UPI00291BBAFA|nr:hypothetical protein [Clostridium neonatale]CAI3544716.1 putative phage protein [Clostridium neonatale]CAI3569358.1 putative phage protein [Clostridium neonatale]CAI3680132.1 putative phage protein [Clostridium neonatale]CAI3721975.1 putative phage protein [Clostridium neonatale]